MTLLQDKLLQLLCEIDELCKKHEIEYCLFAGTGLGADRHRGFIPWDDDADIIMTLENYEKLLKVFESEAGEKRTLNCLEIDGEGYPFTYARYVDTSTAAIQRHTAFGGCDPGIKIDIFVALPTYSDPKDAEQHRLGILAFSEAICPYAIMHHYRPEGFDRVFEKEQKKLNRLGRKKYIDKRMKKLKYAYKGPVEKYVLFSGMMCNSYIIDADILDNIEYVDFEDTKLPLSKENVRFTKELYGEGWMIKPKNVEVPRHTFLLDIDAPYNGYLDSLWGRLDFDRTEKIASRRKKNHLVERDEYKDVLVNNQQIRNSVVKIETNKAFSRMTLKDKENHNQLYELFKEYYDVQLKAINKNYGLFIDITGEAFEKAMNTAIVLDKYYIAAEILKIGLKSRAFSSQDKVIEQLLNRIDICMKLNENLYMYKNWEELVKLIDLAESAGIGESLTAIIASLWLSAIKTDDSSTLKDICSRVDMHLQQYSETGELLVIKGYCLEKMGQIDESAEVFETASKSVTNGFVYQYLAGKGFNTYEGK